MRSARNKKKIMIAAIAGIFASIAVFGSINSLNQKISMQSKQIEYQFGVINSFKQQLINGQETGLNGKSLYVVAKQEIKSGTRISDEMLNIQEFDVKMPDSYSNKLDLIGKISSVNIAQGQIVKNFFIIDPDVEKNKIPAGMRVITIPVNYIDGLASYIKVGTRVDIISTSKGKDSGTEILLQNVKVISLEPQAGKTLDNTFSAMDSSGITLQIPVTTAPKLVNAMQNGKLLLITRDENDKSVIRVVHPVHRQSYSIPTSSSTSLPELPGLSTSIKPVSYEKPSSLPMPASPIRQSKVEVIQANVKTEVSFDN